MTDFILELFQIKGGDKRRKDHMLPLRTIKKGGIAKTSSKKHV